MKHENIKIFMKIMTYETWKLYFGYKWKHGKETDRTKVMKINHAWQGHPSAGRCWMEHIDKILLQTKFHYNLPKNIEIIDFYQFILIRITVTVYNPS